MANYIGISKPLAVVGITPKPEINYFYGPWESINEALNNIPQLARTKGLTVGIVEGSEIVEYWFKNGVDLVLKLVDPKLVYPTARTLVGEKNGTNETFISEYNYIAGSEKLNINGCIYYPNSGFYKEGNNIVLSGAPIPEAGDFMFLEAIYLD